MPKISIIVPVYNVEEYLPQCYASICSQDFADYEVIFIDDESPDGCPALLDKWAKEDARIKVIHKKNGGVSRARNDGIVAAQGDYLFFVDSDDWLADNALSALLDTAKATEADMVISDHVVSSKSGDTYISMFSNEFETIDRSEIDAIQCAVMNMGPANYSTGSFSIKAGSAAPWHHLFKTSLIRDNGLEFDASLKGLFDDGLFTLEALEHASKVAYFPQSTYHYRIVDSSLTQGYNPALKEKFTTVFEALDSFCQRSKNSRLSEAMSIRIYAYLNKAVDGIFLNPKNADSEKTRYQEFCAMAKSEPYATALKNIQVEHLGKKRSRILANLLKSKHYRLYWMMKKMA